jgi:hypothetical protein
VLDTTTLEKKERLATKRTSKGEKILFNLGNLEKLLTF